MLALESNSIGVFIVGKLHDMDCLYLLNRLKNTLTTFNIDSQLQQYRELEGREIYL